jgi:UDP-N-acetylmuramate dehydrogenase
MNALYEVSRSMIVKKIKEIAAGDTFRGDILFDEPMKNHTTLKIGGPADIYAMPRDLDSLGNLLSAFGDNHVPVMPMGGGSNILVSDGGLEGAVVSTDFFDRFEVREDRGDEVKLSVEAGTPLKRLVLFSRDRGYRGIEGLAGIPGFLGGAIWGNAGSFGFEVGDVVESVTVMDMRGKTFCLARENLDFKYRSSRIPDGTIILSAVVRLIKDDPVAMAAKVQDFLQEKMKRQPISRFSAGCVFKNPPGAHAGRLIDEARCKGMRRGDIVVSGLHANFFINRGRGTASDFLALMEEVKERVMKLFNIELEPEIKIVGRDH